MRRSYSRNFTWQARPSSAEDPEMIRAAVRWASIRESQLDTSLRSREIDTWAALRRTCHT